MSSESHLEEYRGHLTIQFLSLVASLLRLRQPLVGMPLQCKSNKVPHPVGYVLTSILGF